MSTKGHTGQHKLDITILEKKAFTNGLSISLCSGSWKIGPAEAALHPGHAAACHACWFNSKMSPKFFYATVLAKNRVRTSWVSDDSAQIVSQHAAAGSRGLSHTY